MLKLFISYSHRDTEQKNRLKSYLDVLARDQGFSIWTDLAIKAGEEWDPAIMKNLESSQVIVLLLSVDFLNSRFCMAREMQSALDLHDSKRSLVIPVIMNPIPDLDYPFNKIQALPKPAPSGANTGVRAMAAWDNFDVVCVHVCEAIGQAIANAKEGFLKDLNRCNIDYRSNEIEQAIMDGEILKACYLLMDFCTDFSPRNNQFKIRAKTITGLFQSLKKDQKDNVNEREAVIIKLLSLLDEVRNEPIIKSISPIPEAA
ncbi:MAG: toll/interleukin-1 receptor domain-containing protein [Chitinophagaceae bacterium]